MYLYAEKMPKAQSSQGRTYKIFNAENGNQGEKTWIGLINDILRTDTWRARGADVRFVFQVLHRQVFPSKMVYVAEQNKKYQVMC